MFKAYECLFKDGKRKNTISMITVTSVSYAFEVTKSDKVDCISKFETVRRFHVKMAIIGLLELERLLISYLTSRIVLTNFFYDCFSHFCFLSSPSHTHLYCIQTIPFFLRCPLLLSRRRVKSKCGYLTESLIRLLRFGNIVTKFY